MQSTHYLPRPQAGAQIDVALKEGNQHHSAGKQTQDLRLVSHHHYIVCSP